MTRTLIFVSILAITAMGIQAQKVLSRTSHSFPRQKLNIIETRSLVAGEIVVQAFDQKGNLVADINQLIMREQDLKLAKRAGISPELQERMAKAGAGEKLEVMIWRRTGEHDFRAIMEKLVAKGMHYEEARRQARDMAETTFAQGNKELTARLTSEGCQVTHCCGPWPIVFAKIPVERIGRWAADPAVDQAYYSFPEWYSENVNAQPTLRSTSCHRAGVDGSKCTVKVMVQDTDNVSNNCPYLPPVTVLNNDRVGSHAMGVAGNICMSLHPQGHYGVAKGLPKLYSAGGSGDTLAPQNWDLGIKAGVSFGNCSWWNGNKGKIVGLDRFFDYTIRQFGVMMFKSNGNQGNSSTPYGTTPGQGYNMTCSGCYNDGNNADWANDKMASYSSWKNPAEGHEKPEVASPGDSIMSTYRTSAGSSNWLGSFGGTSSASPLTCGSATLMASVDASLGAKPELVKAILMASAWHNVEGNALISDKDGVGGVHTYAAVQVVKDKQFMLPTLTTASFTKNRYEQKVMGYCGDEMRIVTLWFSVADKAKTTDVLMMDLDLVVLNPANQVVASSAHAKNPFEIVSFVPSITGMYTVRLVKQRFNNTSERLAIAWSSRQDMATAEVKLTGTGVMGTTLQVGFTDIYNSGHWYMGICSATPLPATITLPDGFILPFGWDSLANLSPIGFSGFVGKLSTSGTAKGSIPLPVIPHLKGLKVHVGMLTLDPVGTNPIRSTSPVETFIIQ